MNQNIRNEIFNLREGNSRRGGGILPETQAYIDMVELDGGTVYNKSLLNWFYKYLKEQDLYTSLSFYTNVNFGIKLRTVSDVNYVTKIYDISVNHNDYIQIVESKQPILSTKTDGSNEIIFPYDNIREMEQSAFSFVNNDNCLTILGKIYVPTKKGSGRRSTIIYDDQSSGDSLGVFQLERADPLTELSIYLQLGTSTSVVTASFSNDFNALYSFNQGAFIGKDKDLAFVMDYSSLRPLLYCDGYYVTTGTLMNGAIFPTTSRKKFIRGSNYNNFSSDSHYVYSAVFNKKLDYIQIADFQELSKKTNIQFPNPVIIFSSDDGVNTDFQQVYPLFKSKGVAYTAFINSSFVGGSNKMTWANCLEMSNDGFEIGSHSTDHTSQTLITDAQLRADLEAENTAFLANGLPTPKNHAYPNGAFNLTVAATVLEYRKTARLYSTGKAIISDITLGQIDSYRIDEFDTNPDLYNDTIKMIDFVNKNKLALNLQFHNIRDANHLQKISDLIDYIQAKNIPIVTQDYFYENYLK